MKSSLNYMTSLGEAGEERKMGEKEKEYSHIPVSFSYLSVLSGFWRQDLIMQLWLSWNSLYRPGKL